MVEGFVTNQEKLEFRGIVLKHLQDILRVSQVEWIGGYWNEQSHSSGGVTNYTREYIPDTREVYTNSVISLSDVLLPYFDEKIKPKYEKYIKILDMNTKELLTLFKDEYLDYLSEKENSATYQNIFYSNKQLSIAKLLFRELNLLLHRIDYLKSAVFGEGEAEEDTDFVEVDK